VKRGDRRGVVVVVEVRAIDACHHLDPEPGLLYTLEKS